MTSSRSQARYEALVFEPLARPRFLVFAAVADVTLVLVALVMPEFLLFLLALVLALPALFLPLLVERGVWEVDGYGVRAHLKPVIPLLPERRETASWPQIDGYQLQAGDWVPRFLKLMSGQRALMTVYQPPDDDDKAAAFDRFAATFVELAEARKIARR